MFMGSVPAALRPHVIRTARDWKASEVWCGCSGNFTLERSIHAERRDLAIHSNDVLLYSSAIGTYLTGGDLDYRLRPDVADRHPWLADAFDGDRAERLAGLLQASRFAPWAMRDGAYFARQMDGYRRQWPGVHGKTTDKLRGLRTRLASFTPGDVVAWMRHCPPDAAVAMYPPFWGAEKAFANDFSALEKLFTWPEPDFVPLDEGRFHELYELIADRREWLLGVNRRLDGDSWDPRWAGHLRGIARTTNRGVPVFVYGSGEARVVIGPAQRTARVPGRRLGPGDELTGPLALVPLSDGQFAMLRSAYMNPSIRPGTADAAIGVTAGRVLIGVFAVNRPRSYPDPHRAYLLSDFPVAPSDYPRLSKLVLYAALSVEARRLMERLSNVAVESVLTTAFTDRPVSMKYRGLFDLHSRKELDVSKESWGRDIPADDPYYGQAWMLNYVSDTGRWTLADGLADWQRRHGKRTGTGRTA